MILDLTYYGNPVLRQKGARIDNITPEIQELARDMVETMHDASGIGLAAQQVGHALQLAVIDIPADAGASSRMWIQGQPVPMETFMPLVLINPELKTVKKKETAEEGCLSFPGISGTITRPTRVTCHYQNLRGESLEFDADGLLGRAVQHEVDHLNGVLFTDHMPKEEKSAQREEIEIIRQQGLEQTSA